MMRLKPRSNSPNYRFDFQLQEQFILNSEILICCLLQDTFNSKLSSQVVTVFPIRQQIISVCESQPDPQRSDPEIDAESTAGPDFSNTVVIRSSYATANGISERQLICDVGECPISKVADAMVNEHEKVEAEL